MQQLLLLLYSLLLYYVIGFMTTADCDCTELELESDCLQRLTCFWDQGCLTKTCKDYHTEDECNQAYGCAWNSTKACSGFTLCSDYAFQNPNYCYLISTVCVPGQQQENEYYTCQPGTIRCKDITNQSLCTPLLAQPDNRPCYYLNEECQPQDVSDCTTITNPTICKEYNCIWSNLTCLPGNCTDIQIEEQCTYISTGTADSKFVCQWQNNSCISAPDTSSFSQEDCYSHTGGSYAWINDACTKCQGKNNLILFIYFIIILLIN